MSLDTPIPTSATSLNTVEPKRFTPSVVAVREHRARQQADRILDQFTERFTEKDFFPEDGDDVLFAMLTQLPQWPADMQISILDDEGDVAGYLKGNDESIALHAVVLVQHDDGSYSEPGQAKTYIDESLFRAIFNQIPSTSELGRGGLDNSIPSLIATLRGQVAGLARSKRTLLFDALMADANAVKSDPQTRLPNPFLPLWTLATADRSPVLAKLRELNPELPAERLEDLLDTVPLTEAQESDFLQDGAMPEDFVAALTTSRAEWTSNRAIDGLLHTRTYDPHTDALARQLTQRLLKTRPGRELAIVEPGDDGYQPSGSDDNHVVLWHGGDGTYLAEDLRAGEINGFWGGTDSFYLAVSSLLQPTERTTLGIQEKHDVAGFRRALANLAIEDNGGWFDPESPAEINSEFLPDWLKQASPADKLAWKGAVQAYSQAMLEAQAPGLLDLSAYGKPAQLRHYAREKLRERLKVDHGLELNPDEIFIQTAHAEVTGWLPVDTEYGLVDPAVPADVNVTTHVRSLTNVCLENIALTDFDFWLTARSQDSQGQRIRGLTKSYVISLVRELNVGEAYPEFLKTRLLTSLVGQWCRERYAQVMQAQMRLDALEAKMAGDYLEDGKSPAGQEDRGYKWVTAVLDQPVEDGKRGRVDSHRIQVQHLRINGLKLDGLLIIGAASRSSVAPVVIYTPQAPDGKCFRELDSLEDLKHLLINSDYLDYLINLAPLDARTKVRNALVHNWRTLIVEAVPYTGNFLEAAYEAQVKRVIAQVDEQTNSTWEKDWKSAWEIIRTVGEIVLEFTPLKVRLPLAALRSLYAVAQGVRGADNGDQNASLHFVAAALLLVDALPSPKRKTKPLRVNGSSLSNLNPKTALSKAPGDLRQRTDGVYNGVYEASHDGASSSFYVVQSGKTYPVRYDRDFMTWRLIDPRRPDAYYQMPISFKGGEWTHSSVGLLSGGRKAAKKETPGPSTDSTAAQTTTDGAQRYTLDLTGLEQSKAFKKADQHIQDRVQKSVKKVTEHYADIGGGRFHGYTPKGEKEKIFTLDLTGIPGGTGRGPWRLQLKVSTEEGKKGVLVFHAVVDKH